MKIWLASLACSAIIVLGAGKEIGAFASKLTSPTSAMAQGQAKGAIQGVRDYAGTLDRESGRTADEYKYLCKKCKTGFDVPDFGGKCPHCGSKKLIQQKETNTLNERKKLIDELAN